jgi:hypothetical protein
MDIDKLIKQAINTHDIEDIIFLTEDLVKYYPDLFTNPHRSDTVKKLEKLYTKLINDFPKS